MPDIEIQHEGANFRIRVPEGMDAGAWIKANRAKLTNMALDASGKAPPKPAPPKLFRSREQAKQDVQQQTIRAADAAGRTDLSYSQGTPQTITGKSKLKSGAALTKPKPETAGQKIMRGVGKVGEKVGKVVSAPMRLADQAATEAVLGTRIGKELAKAGLVEYEGVRRFEEAKKAGRIPQYLNETPFTDALLPSRMEELNRDPSLGAGALRFGASMVTPGNALPLGGIARGSQAISRGMGAAFGLPAVAAGTEQLGQAQNPGQILEGILNTLVGGLGVAHAGGAFTPKKPAAAPLPVKKSTITPAPNIVDVMQRPLKPTRPFAPAKMPPATPVEAAQPAKVAEAVPAQGESYISFGNQGTRNRLKELGFAPRTINGVEIDNAPISDFVTFRDNLATQLAKTPERFTQKRQKLQEGIAFVGRMIGDEEGSPSIRTTAITTAQEPAPPITSEPIGESRTLTPIEATVQPEGTSNIPQTRYVVRETVYGKKKAYEVYDTQSRAVEHLLPGKRDAQATADKLNQSSQPSRQPQSPVTVESETVTQTKQALPQPSQPNESAVTNVTVVTEKPPAVLTSPKNAVTEAERAKRGQTPVERQAYTTIPDAYEAGKAVVESGKTEPRSLAASVAAKPRPLNAEEVGALAYDRVQIINQHEAATRKLADAIDKKDTAQIETLSAEMKRLEDDLSTNDEALVKGGREQSAAFNARKMVIGSDFRLAPTLQRAKAAKLGELTPQERTKFEGLTAKLSELEGKLKDAETALRATQEKQTAPRQNKSAQGGFKLSDSERAKIDAAKERIRGKLSQVGAAPDVTILADVVEIGSVYVQAGVRSLREWKAQMRVEVPGVSDDTLNEAWRNIAENVERQNKSRTTRLGEEIKELSERVKAKKWELPTRPKGAEPTAQVKVLAAQRDLLKSKITAEVNKLRPKTFGQKVAEVVAVPRSLITSIDLSAPLRQGSVLSLANPRLAAKSVVPMLRAMRSEVNAKAIENDIKARPNFEKYEESGLYLAPLDETSRLSKREEAYMSTLAEKFPGVRPSERAYVTYLNKLRADTFDMFEKSLPNAKPEELAAVADFINTATGRGKLGATGERAAGLLTNIFFSPRYLTSRVQMITGEPFYSQAGRAGEARARKLVARTYLQYAGTVTGIILLAKQGGAEVETDPRHTDFLKLKSGNTVVDVLAGLQQAGTFLSRIATGKKITAGDKEKDLTQPGFKGDTRLSVAGDFLRGKAAPVPGSIMNLLSGTDIAGKPANLKTEAVRLTVPMSWPDVYQAAKEEGIPQGSAVFLMSLFGLGTQYRSKADRPQKKAAGGTSSLVKFPKTPTVKVPTVKF